MSLYDIAEERNRRLERADAHISRCGECGAWQWMGRCATNHDAHVVFAGQMSYTPVVSDAGAVCYRGTTETAPAGNRGLTTNDCRGVA